MNDRDRSEWISNDEGLYNWYKASGQTKAIFIQVNRNEIDRVIDAILNGRKPAHFLAYGGW